MPDAASFDPLGALRTLVRHGVAFVVIGGIAARLHGSPTVTNDLDICYERSEANFERLGAALVEVDAYPRGAPPGLPFVADAATLAGGDRFTLQTTAGGLDCLGTPAGTRGYQDLTANAERWKIAEGLEVQVTALADLIRMKRASGRPKDRIELEVLGALRDEIGE